MSITLSSLENNKRLYQLIGVSNFSPIEDVRSAYKMLALKYHPDKTCGDVESTEKFKEIKLIYELLSNEERKRRYDASLRVYLSYLGVNTCDYLRRTPRNYASTSYTAESNVKSNSSVSNGTTYKGNIHYNGMDNNGRKTRSYSCNYTNNNNLHANANIGNQNVNRSNATSDKSKKVNSNYNNNTTRTKSNNNFSKGNNNKSNSENEVNSVDTLTQEGTSTKSRKKSVVRSSRTSTIENNATNTDDNNNNYTNSCARNTTKPNNISLDDAHEHKSDHNSFSNDKNIESNSYTNEEEMETNKSHPTHADEEREKMRLAQERKYELLHEHWTQHQRASSASVRKERRRTQSTAKPMNLSSVARLGEFNGNTRQEKNDVKNNDVHSSRVIISAQDNVKSNISGKVKSNNVSARTFIRNTNTSNNAVISNFDSNNNNNSRSGEVSPNRPISTIQQEEKDKLSSPQNSISREASTSLYGVRIPSLNLQRVRRTESNTRSSVQVTSNINKNNKEDNKVRSDGNKKTSNVRIVKETVSPRELSFSNTNTTTTTKNLMSHFRNTFERNTCATEKNEQNELCERNFKEMETQDDSNVSNGNCCTNDITLINSNRNENSCEVQENVASSQIRNSCSLLNQKFEKVTNKKNVSANVNEVKHKQMENINGSNEIHGVESNQKEEEEVEQVNYKQFTEKEMESQHYQSTLDKVNSSMEQEYRQRRTSITTTSNVTPRGIYKTKECNGYVDHDDKTLEKSREVSNFEENSNNKDFTNSDEIDANNNNNSKNNMFSSVSANVTGVRHRVSAIQSPSSRTSSLSRLSNVDNTATNYTNGSKEVSYVRCNDSTSITSGQNTSSDGRFAGFQTPRPLTDRVKRDSNNCANYPSTVIASRRFHTRPFIFKEVKKMEVTPSTPVFNPETLLGLLANDEEMERVQLIEREEVLARNRIRRACNEIMRDVHFGRPMRTLMDSEEMERYSLLAEMRRAWNAIKLVASEAHNRERIAKAEHFHRKQLLGLEASAVYFAKKKVETSNHVCHSVVVNELNGDSESVKKLVSVQEKENTFTTEITDNNNNNNSNTNLELSRITRKSMNNKSRERSEEAKTMQPVREQLRESLQEEQQLETLHDLQHECEISEVLQEEQHLQQSEITEWQEEETIHKQRSSQEVSSIGKHQRRKHTKRHGAITITPRHSIVDRSIRISHSAEQHSESAHKDALHKVDTGMEITLSSKKENVDVVHGNLFDVIALETEKRCNIIAYEESSCILLLRQKCNTCHSLYMHEQNKAIEQVTREVMEQLNKLKTENAKLVSQLQGNFATVLLEDNQFSKLERST